MRRVVRIGKILLGIILFIGIMASGISMFMNHQIDQNTSEVDAVSGATMSSKTIKAAVRNALIQGIRK